MDTMSTAKNSKVFIPQVWTAEILMQRRNKLVARDIIDLHYSSDVKNLGDRIHIPGIKSFEAKDITPGQELDVTVPENDDREILIDKYNGSVLQIQDVLKAQSKYDLRTPYTSEMSNALAKRLDSDILAEYKNADTKNILAGTDKITLKSIIDLTETLDAANVPDDQRSIVVDSFGLALLRNVKEFVDYGATGAVGLVSNGANNSNPGLKGEIYGAKVYMTNNLPKDGANSNLLLIHKSAIGAAIQKESMVENDRNIRSFSNIISTSQLYGVKTIRPDHMAVLPLLGKA